MNDSIETYATLIAQLGFPIFVAVYLLLRIDRVLSDLTAAIVNLTALIDHKLP